jgi:drug/metabolite transporter (DMT)-like permease
MTLILISIVLSGALIICFKVFETFNINSSNAISINYLFASSAGIAVGYEQFSSTNIIHSDWFPYTLLFGIMFISTFNLVAHGVKTSGLMVVSIAQKMSLIIPLAFSIIYYDESAGWMKILGITLAIIAIYFSSKKTNEEQQQQLHWKILLIPAFIFIGSGIVDISIKVSQEHFGAQAPFSIILACIFGSAGIVGIIQKLIQKASFQTKDVIGGMCLGLLNFSSTFFLMKALSSDTFESSFVFAVNNIGIILFNSMVANIVFKERISKTNAIGIVLALISILMIYFANII